MYSLCIVKDQLISRDEYPGYRETEDAEYDDQHPEQAKKNVTIREDYLHFDNERITKLTGFCLWG